MKLATSYFYQIRFFKPYMIPFSTAVWDPKWYHEFQGHEHVFKDRRGVLNGFRVDALHPGPELEGECSGLSSCSKSPTDCAFIRGYSAQLHALDCTELVHRLERLTGVIKQNEGFLEEPVAVLIVHEAPGNICSERVPLQQWFQEFGYDCKELIYPIK